MSNKQIGAIRVAAFAAFYGDRADGFDEAIACEPEILVGDYLAELTMLVLKKVQSRGGPGYAAGFLKDLEPRLPAIARAGLKVVTNAGGLDPLGCAAAVKALCQKHGINLRIATITGDNLLENLQAFHEQDNQSFANLDSHAPLRIDWKHVLTANAYLGAWPIARALAAGADIVICPRVTDASLVMGPAAWKHRWKANEWDKLAGALVAGHLLECGTQVTGGNFSFFKEIDRARLPGMPYADIFSDGAIEIGKAPHTGGIVSIDTLKAQLLYEIGGPFYQNPDVVVDLRSVRLEEKAADIVRVFGCEGHPPTPNLKVSLCYDGGYRNSMTVGLTGLNSIAKAQWLEQIVNDRIGSSRSFDDFNVSIIGPADPGGPSYDDNTALMVISAADRDKAKVSRERFSNVLLSSAFNSLPGCYFTTPPQSERQIAIQWPCLVEKRLVHPEVRIDDELYAIAWSYGDESKIAALHPPNAPPRDLCADAFQWSHPAESRPLGILFGTRSGDKGGTANLGIWARSADAWAWLEQWLTVDALKHLLPELRELKVERHNLANLYALNFVVYRFIGDGVSACLRVDAQAKGLGEYLSARCAPIPESLFSEKFDLQAALKAESTASRSEA